MKLLGMILLIGGSSGIAYTYREELKKNLEQLRYLQQILCMLQSEIHYHKATLPEACRQIGNRVTMPYSQALCNVYQIMKENTGLTFPMVWRQEMKKCMKQLCISSKDKELFLHFADSSGYADHDMQIKAIEQYEAQLGQSISRMEQSIENKSRVIMSVGVMGGILLTIILI